MRWHERENPRNNTRRILRHTRNAFLLLGALTALPPVVHWQTTLQFVTGNTDCSTGFLGSLANQNFDTLAIATGGITTNPDGSVAPNSFTARREQAAAYWLVDTVRSGKPMPVIWLLDGNTSTENKNVERDYFKQAVWKLSDHTVSIPDSQFRIDGAFNTSESTDHFAAGFKSEGGKRAILFTDDFHSKRLSMLACANGIPSRTMTTEQILMEKYPDRKDAILAWMNSKYVAYLNGREARKRLTLLWFPNGEVLTTMKKTHAENPDSIVLQVIDPKPENDVIKMTPDIPDPLATP